MNEIEWVTMTHSERTGNAFTQVRYRSGKCMQFDSVEILNLPYPVRRFIKEHAKKETFRKAGVVSYTFQ